MNIRSFGRLSIFVGTIVLSLSSISVLSRDTDSGSFAVAKSVPTNAVKPDYTLRMIESDRYLAQMFAGPGAVAAANGFEPIGLAGQYPIYRGDLRGADGRIRRGHLSYAMHVYGSADGTGTTALYVPEGFTSHSTAPTPTDAAITFYYPRLGDLTNVTVAVFHIANFAIFHENGRVRIGETGGRGGSYQYYRHSHIEFYSGNVGLPSGSRRSALRIDPAGVFRSDLRDLAVNHPICHISFDISHLSFRPLQTTRSVVSYSLLNGN